MMHRTPLLVLPALSLLLLGACTERPAETPAEAASGLAATPTSASAPAQAPAETTAEPKNAPAPAAENATPAAKLPQEKRLAQATPTPVRTSPAPSGSDWAQFRGPTGQGTAADKGTPTSWSATENVVWKTPLPGAGTSTPIVLGQRIYVTSYTGAPNADLKRQISAVDRASGRILWTTEVAAPGPEQDRIREEHGYASSSPAADAERVYCFFGKAGVYAFDHSGKQLWKAPVGDNIHGWGSAASPVLHGNLVFINASVESESLIALDRRTGKEAWRVGGIKESWNTPILVKAPGGKTELVMAIFGKVLGYEPETGKELWSCATGINWYMVPSLVEKDGIVYCIGGRSGGALAVKVGGRGDVTGSHRVWTGTKGSNVSSPVIFGDHMYWAKDSPAVAFCADLKTGNVVYEERMDQAGQVYASAVLADGKVYYVGRSGRTYVVPAKPTFEVLAVNELGERGTYNSSPSVAGGKLFMRSDRNLYCLGTK
jgi:outer membrane protein assembly factor BamB